MAIALAILDDTNLKHPKLEVIFTTEEETTMNGAKCIDLTMIKGKKMICLDNMYEDELWIGCASCYEWNCSLEAKQSELEQGDFGLYAIELYGFIGGHSGLDIGKKRGNPILLMAELLQELAKQTPIYIQSIVGGIRVNVIPTKCQCTLFLDEKDMETIKNTLLDYKLKMLKEFNFDNKLKFEFYKKEKIENKKVFSTESMNHMLQFLNDYQNGVQKWDKDGNIILSSNFGVIDSNKGKIELGFSMRCNEQKYVLDYVRNMEKEIDKHEIQIKEFLELPGYEHKETSDFISRCKYEYMKYFNRKPKLVKMHVGLEAGFFNNKIANLDFVAIAPNIWDAHSPNEKVSISSTNKVYEYITILLKNT